MTPEDLEQLERLADIVRRDGSNPPDWILTPAGWIYGGRMVQLWKRGKLVRVPTAAVRCGAFYKSLCEADEPA